MVGTTEFYLQGKLVGAAQVRRGVIPVEVWLWASVVETTRNLAMKIPLE